MPSTKANIHAAAADLVEYHLGRELIRPSGTAAGVEEASFSHKIDLHSPGFIEAVLMIVPDISHCEGFQSQTSIHPLMWYGDPWPCDGRQIVHVQARRKAVDYAARHFRHELPYTIRCSFRITSASNRSLLMSMRLLHVFSSSPGGPTPWRF